MTTQLSPGGTHFLQTCGHCGQSRQEPVDPGLNPHPFRFATQCNGCGQPLAIDHALVSAVQGSYLRAKKNDAPAWRPGRV